MCVCLRLTTRNKFSFHIDFLAFLRFARNRWENVQRLGYCGYYVISYRLISKFLQSQPQPEWMEEWINFLIVSDVTSQLNYTQHFIFMCLAETKTKAFSHIMPRKSENEEKIVIIKVAEKLWGSCVRRYVRLCVVVAYCFPRNRIEGRKINANKRRKKNIKIIDCL